MQTSIYPVQIDDSIASQVVLRLMAFERAAPGTPIIIYINSDGGGTWAANAIIDTIRGITSPVHTIGMGRVRSFATVVFACMEIKYSSEIATTCLETERSRSYDFRTGVRGG